MRTRSVGAEKIHGRRSMVMEMFVGMGLDIAAGEHFFEMARELGINRHQVFEVAVLGTVLHHPELAVALDDLRFDLAHFLVHEDVDGQVAVENLLADFGHALRTERVGLARPAQWRLGFFPSLQQRFFGPLRGRRRIGSNAVQAFKDGPCARGGDGDGLLDVLNRLMHSALAFLGCEV